MERSRELIPETRGNQFLSHLYHGISLHNTLSTCLLFVQLQSNFHHSLTRYIADVAGTLESVIWLSGRAAWTFLLSSLLPNSRTCRPAAVYPVWAFSIPSVLDIVSYLCLLLLSFPWLLWRLWLLFFVITYLWWVKSAFLVRPIQYNTIQCNTDCRECLIRYPFVFLLLLDRPSHFSGHFQQDCLDTFPEIFWG